ncbi:MAG: DUF6035 family protein, partial [Cyclobacteriaceae bacterium]
MAQFERSIKLAVDRLSGELIVADEAFAKSKEAFAIRHQAHSGELDLYCRECNQKLTVPTSKYDRIHFRHLPNAEYCILKDGNLSPEEIEQFNKILIAKESERHKELKRKIAKKLLKVEGVDAASITIDDKFIIRGNEKRGPDVYCRYWDKQLVFEIQLSNLSLRYILSRYNFYKKHSIYLIWVLDNFDVHKQGQLERDIKYLSEHQIFFNLDEKVED